MVEARSCACAWQVMPSNQPLEVEPRFGLGLDGSTVEVSTGNAPAPSRSAPQKPELHSLCIYLHSTMRVLLADAQPCTCA